LVVEQALDELVSAVERYPIEHPTRVDRMPVFGGAVGADRVEVLEAEPQRIDDGVTPGAARIGPVRFEGLPYRRVFGELERRHIELVRYGRGWAAQKLIQHPDAALDRRRPVWWGGGHQKARLREQAHAGSVRGGDAHECV